LFIGQLVTLAEVKCFEVIGRNVKFSQLLAAVEGQTATMSKVFGKKKGNGKGFFGGNNDLLL